jgi:hypothetical protein
VEPIGGFPVFDDKGVDVGFTVKVKHAKVHCTSSTSMETSSSMLQLSYEDIFALLSKEKR